MQEAREEKKQKEESRAVQIDHALTGQLESRYRTNPVGE